VLISVSFAADGTYKFFSNARVVISMITLALYHTVIPNFPKHLMLIFDLF